MSLAGVSVSKTTQTRKDQTSGTLIIEFCLPFSESLSLFEFDQHALIVVYESRKVKDDCRFKMIVDW